MRGADQPQSTLFSYVSVEDRIPADHPLRTIRALVQPILTALSPRFDALYARHGRPSIPPERLLRALLLQVLYTIRSERQLMEQIDYNLLFRWFVGLNPDDAIWVPSVFSKNRGALDRG
jgi:transposase